MLGDAPPVGLLADKDGEAQISTAMRVLAEIIASDVSLLVTFNQAIEAVIQNNQKARQNPKALAQLDGYKRPLVSYADLNRGHEGKIYQASNWLFVGETGFEAGITLNGKSTHRRTINSKYGTSTIEWLQSACCSV